MTSISAVRTQGPSFQQRAPHLRLTRRGRVVIGMLVLVPLLGMLAGFTIAGASAAATDSSSQTQFQYLTVQSGESLWSIAEMIAPEADPRDVVADIARLNNLDGSSVQAGQRLAIPAAYDF